MQILIGIIALVIALIVIVLFLINVMLNLIRLEIRDGFKRIADVLKEDKIS